MMAQPVPARLEVAAPEFFATPFKKLAVEENAGTGRVYILKGGRIVAVAKLKERDDGEHAYPVATHKR